MGSTVDLLPTFGEMAGAEDPKDSVLDGYDISAVLRGGDFFFQAEDGIRDGTVTGVQTCALPIYSIRGRVWGHRTARRSSAVSPNAATDGMGWLIQPNVIRRFSRRSRTGTIPRPVSRDRKSVV